MWNSQNGADELGIKTSAGKTESARAKLNDAISKTSDKRSRKNLEQAAIEYEKYRDRQVADLQKEVQLYRTLVTAGISAATFAHESTGGPIRVIKTNTNTGADPILSRAAHSVCPAQAFSPNTTLGSKRLAERSADHFANVFWRSPDPGRACLNHAYPLVTNMQICQPKYLHITGVGESAPSSPRCATRHEFRRTSVMQMFWRAS